MVKGHSFTPILEPVVFCRTLLCLSLSLMFINDHSKETFLSNHMVMTVLSYSTIFNKRPQQDLYCSMLETTESSIPVLAIISERARRNLCPSVSQKLFLCQMTWHNLVDTPIPQLHSCPLSHLSH